MVQFDQIDQIEKGIFNLTPVFSKVFLNYMLNVVDKGIFPYMSEQELP